MTMKSTLSATSKRLAALTVALATLSACQTNLIGTTLSHEGIGNRYKRSTEIAEGRAWRTCHEEAIVLDAQARKSASAARYITSARALEACEANLDNTDTVPTEDRMRSYAVSVQNYLRGGDSAAARRNLDRFKTAFGGKDLFYADGSSFTETMELLLGLAEKSAAGAYSIANVSSAVKGEVRRMRYWKHM